MDFGVLNCFGAFLRPIGDLNTDFEEIQIEYQNSKKIDSFKIKNNSLVGDYIRGNKLEYFKTLLFNKISFGGILFSSKASVDDFLSNYFSNKSPTEVLTQTLEYIYTISDVSDKTFEIRTSDFNNSEEWRRLFLSSFGEFKFYLLALADLHYVEFKGTLDSWFGKMTISGLTFLHEKNLKKQTKICFTAMAFNDDMFKVYKEAIEPAIRSTGFIPEIVSDLQIESDTTINDKIIAGIKKAHFTISDFSYHKNGVYFEAGMALGRGQKVIYTCKESDIGSAHFDVRNYQILIWKDAEDFRVKLIDKIEAFIKD